MIGILIIPMLFGIRPFVVLSGSMEPVIHTGSLCYINEKVESTDIVTGDVIAFNAGDATVVHRVIGVDENGHFITKGDANEVQDLAPVSSANFAGKQVFAIPYMGYVSQWLQSKTGIVAVVAAIALSFLSSIIYRSVEEPKKVEGDEVVAEDKPVSDDE
jgi:signal peptidase